MIIYILSATFFGLLSYFLYLVVKRLFFPFEYAGIKLPPGPFAWPFIGNYWGGNKKMVYHYMLKNLVPKYGKVVTMWWGRYPIVFINDFKIAYEALGQQHGRKLAGRHSSYLDTLVSEGGNNIFDNNYGPLWIELVSTLKDALVKSINQSSYVNTVHDTVHQFMDELIARPENQSEGIYPFDECYWLSDNIVLGSFIGRTFGLNDEEYQILYDTRKEVFDVLDNADFANWVPFAQYLPIPSVVRVKTQSDKLNKLLISLVDEVKSRGKYLDNPTVICEHILQKIEKSENKKVPIKELNVRQILKDILFASYEGIGLTNNWFMALLAQYPDIQEKIRADALEISRKTNETVPQLSWKEEAHYINAVALEFFRYSSIVGILDFHYSLEPVTLCNGKYNIPKDIYVAINQYSINHNPEIFPQPEKIDPSRFLNEQGQFYERRDSVTFGMGIRMCPGTLLTKSYAFLLLCTICMNYKLEWTSKNEADRLIDDPENSGLFRYPKDYYVKFSKL